MGNGKTDIATLYQKGSTLAEIAELSDCTPPTIASRLRELGITIRPRGRQRIELPLPRKG